MKKILINTGYNIFDEECSYKELSEKVLQIFYGRKITKEDLPINPFEILERSGAIYMLADFTDLEGFYCLPENDEVGVVGINKNRGIERQRFTAAHELCHHLKDEDNIICKIGMTDSVEKYANNFASELLFPSYILEKVLIDSNLEKRDMIKVLSGAENKLDEILKISVIFGTSMEATVIKILNYFNFSYEYPELKKILKKYKPNKRKKILEIENSLNLWSQVIDSYHFLEVAPPKELKTQFLNYVIENDHRIENGNLNVIEIRKTLMKIRNGIDCNQLNSDEVEVLGQYLMYEKIFDQSVTENSYLYILFLHKQFYEYAPYPEVGGTFRTASTRINGTNVKTCSPDKIGLQVYNMSLEIDNFLKQKSRSKTSFLLEKIIKWHHGLTVIHPFYDGNGRTIRAFSNSLLLTFNIPPIFILETEKHQYRNGLVSMDEDPQKTEDLLEFILKKIVYNYSHFLDDYNLIVP